MKKFSILAILAIVLFSCENTMTKKFGGNMTIELPQGKKFVNITWKDDQLWYLTKNMTASDSAETYTFHEKSKHGVFEGTVTINEHK